MSWFRIAWSFARRDALIAMTYRIAFLMPLASIFFAVPIFYFMAQVATGGTEAEGLQLHQGNFFAFLLLGMAFQDYVTLSMSSFLNGVREHQLMGTMEIVMLSPTPVPLILLASSLWGYLFGTVRFVLYLMGGLAFGLDLSGANLLSFALLTLTAIVSFAALGIFAAAATLIIKQGASVVTLLTAVTLAFGGVLYPISVLPEWLQTLAQLLPFTHALAGVRKALLFGATPAELGAELLALSVFGVTLFPSAIWAFQRALARSKMTGTLGQY